MKKANYYFTLCLVLYTTIFSFIHMSEIVQITMHVIQVIVNNLLPSLLPFMILISLCLSLGILPLLSYFIQFIFSPLFHLSPMMSSIYLISFFCGYPTNAKIIKESYELEYININQLQHLLSICSFCSLSFIFVSLHLSFKTSLMIYISHILPSIFIALCYHKDYQLMSYKDVKLTARRTFIDALKYSIKSSIYAFIFILGYMLVFQCIGYSLSFMITNDFIYSMIQGLLEFSSGSMELLGYSNILVYPLISFSLSFSGLSVLMQVDNILEDIPYSFKSYFISRLFHGIGSFMICWMLQYWI
ncbi:MAG: hypothetical protein LUG12_05885 [Erysipelotrichaceae bacterium]|nr:hypothetical protein [Erysipelotrichaceae bacterium]